MGRKKVMNKEGGLVILWKKEAFQLTESFAGDGFLGVRGCGKKRIYLVSLLMYILLV